MVDMRESRMKFMAVLNPGKPKRFDGKKKKVTWSSVILSSILATIGDNAMRSSLTPRPPLLLGPTLPADTVTALTEPALDTEILELADVDEIELIAAAERKAIADSELKVQAQHAEGQLRYLRRPL